ncbi:MAG TPA: FKBP-type peptidyl-prolyl cis-trans isomerase [Chthoniobacterales bacterium]|jgi:peptidylprolyl isomerase|nr:FKBP-type peptidyl-prolyl cis-trans isomerase [Chthoniobacterales bacterium]
MRIRTVAVPFLLSLIFGVAFGAEPIPAPDDVAAPPADAEKTESGLASKVLEPGKGTTHPARTDLVTVHYSGWTTDGKNFDSSLSRGKPVTFPLDKVIAGWTEGVQLMVAGEKRRLWIPEDLAYKGKEGRPSGMLVFDVQLISFKAPAPQEAPSDPTKAPDDVQRAPADAKRTESGLSYKILRRGTGTEHPEATSSVTVNYSGWTTDGRLFDSTYPRHDPQTLKLNRVIAGWTEGLQLMVVGEKRRFWIPESLAYAGQGPVNGDLVFDIELLKINQP